MHPPFVIRGRLRCIRSRLRMVDRDDHRDRRRDDDRGWGGRDRPHDGADVRGNGNIDIDVDGGIRDMSQLLRCLQFAIELRIRLRLDCALRVDLAHHRRHRRRCVVLSHEGGRVSIPYGEEGLQGRVSELRVGRRYGCMHRDDSCADIRQSHDDERPDESSIVLDDADDDHDHRVAYIPSHIRWPRAVRANHRNGRPRVVQSIDVVE